MKPIEYLSPYLPYDVRFKSKITGDVDVMEYLDSKYNRVGRNAEYAGEGEDYIICHSMHEILPILRPLSDLTKEIEHNGEKFVPIDYFEIGDNLNEFREVDFGNIKLIEELENISTHNLPVNYLPYDVVQILISWHFDVFNLHEKGLCIYYDEI